MSNQTFKNEENNRGQKLKNEAISLLRPLWLSLWVRYLKRYQDATKITFFYKLISLKLY